MEAVGFTEQQRDFALAVREFCRRECGTREQRDAWTGNGAEEHHSGLYQKLLNSGISACHSVTSPAVRRSGF